MIGLEIRRDGETIVVTWTDPTGEASSDTYISDQPQYAVYDALLEDEEFNHE